MDFKDLQVVVDKSSIRNATFEHRKILDELIKGILLENYPENFNKFDVLNKGIKQENDEIDIYKIIENVAVSITSKESCKHSKKTIIAYLGKFVEKPGLSRRAIKEECLSEAEDEAVKKDFIERAGDSTVIGWENNLEKEKSEIEKYMHLE